MVWIWLKKNRVALISLGFILLISLLALLAPFVTHFSFEEQNIADRLQGPSSLHWMGTDALGRDLYSRIIYGARMSIAVGICTAVFSLVLGTFSGAISGYWGGSVDVILTRIIDLFFIFPAPLLAILLGLVFGRGAVGIMIAIGLTSWVTQARMVRGLTLQLKTLPYIEAAKSLGCSHWSIIFRHLLPNMSGPIIVSLTAQIPSNIMTESFLSFIGLGLQPPYSSWGTLANEGFRAIQSYPHLIIFPGVVLFSTMLAFNYLGDGLDDYIQIYK
jgi:oligopeptide transport system permease protein